MILSAKSKVCLIVASSYSSSLVTAVGARPRFHDEALRSSQIVVAAVPKRVYQDLPLKQLAGKVVIDCSNRDTSKAKIPM